MRSRVCFQGEVSKQLSEPTPPVRGPGPDQHGGARGHLPALLPQIDGLVSATAQQEAPTLPGAEELQGQLQHSGQHSLRGCSCEHSAYTNHCCLSVRVNT